MIDYSNFSMLLVDDESDIVEFLSEEFSDIGFATHCAEGVRSAVSLMNNNSYDIIISDYRMPDGNGLDILEASKHLQCDPHFYFISGEADILPDEAIRLGAKKFYSKPFDIDELIDSVTTNLVT